MEGLEADLTVYEITVDDSSNLEVDFFDCLGNEAGTIVHACWHILAATKESEQCVTANNEISDSGLVLRNAEEGWSIHMMGSLSDVGRFH